jgi:hypothetical protein
MLQAAVVWGVTTRDSVDRTAFRKKFELTFPTFTMSQTRRWSSLESLSRQPQVSGTK